MIDPGQRGADALREQLSLYEPPPRAPTAVAHAEVGSDRARLEEEIRGGGSGRAGFREVLGSGG